MMHPSAFRLTLGVLLAFLLVIAVWVTAFALSRRVDTRTLTPAEEAALIERKGGRL